MEQQQGLDEVEYIKMNSKNLRGGLKEELSKETDGFNDEDKILLKFHGMYQQKTRDKDIPDEEKVHTFMLRGRIPGGRLTHEQWAVWDSLSERFGAGSLRLTTRQSVQLHSLLKKNIKQVIQEINQINLSSMGACGDVVRNVTQAVNPFGRDDIKQLDAIANLLSDHFKYTSNTYHEIWLDNKLINPESEQDKIYGNAYLPKKFKIAVTIAGDNSVDIYTNDMGFAATFGSDKKIDGYFVFAGGGMGMTHNKPATYPKTADLLGWIQADQLIPIAEGIVTAYRDHGDRVNRKHARLKYILAEKGVEWFRKEVESRAGSKFIQKELPAWETPSYLGWAFNNDGTMSLGFHLLSGRIIDTKDKPLRSALKEIISTYKLNVQVTPDQDLILMGISATDQAAIDKRLKELNCSPVSPSKLYNRALACVSLPTCSLALTESERYFPRVLTDIQKVLDKHGLSNDAPIIRMTGCPNGCARPFAAEIGIVGQQNGGKYAIYVGGAVEGTRLAKQIAQKISINDFETFFDKLFKLWKNERKKGELFGDYAYRITPAVLEEKMK